MTFNADYGGTIAGFNTSGINIARKISSSPEGPFDGVYFALRSGRKAFRISQDDAITVWEASPANADIFKLGDMSSDGFYYVTSGDGLLQYNVEGGTKTLLYQTSDYGQGTVLVKSSVAYFGDSNNIYAYDLDASSLIWKDNVGDAPFEEKALIDGELYFGDLGGDLYSYDAQSGNQSWVYDSGSYSPKGPIIIGGTLYSGSANGKSFSVDISDGTENWKSNNDYGSVYYPIYIDGKIIHGTDEASVVAVDIDDGSELWKYSPGSFDLYVAGLSLLDGVVYGAEDSGDVFSIDASDGSENWKVNEGEYGDLYPAIQDDLLYVSNDNIPYKVKVFDIDDGSIVRESESFDNEVEEAGVLIDGAQWSHHEKVGRLSDPGE